MANPRRSVHPPPGHTVVRAIVSEDLARRVRKAGIDTQRTITSVIIEALEKFAREHGYPPDAAPESDVPPREKRS